MKIIRPALIIVFSIISIILAFFHNFFSVIAIIIFSLYILDKTSDDFFDEVYSFLDPDLRYILSISLLSFIVSLDEIMVSGASIITGHAMISTGALMGSSAITVVMMAVALVSFRKRADFKSNILFIIFPVSLIFAGLVSGIPFLETAIDFGVLIVSAIFLIYLSLKGFHFKHSPGRSKGKFRPIDAAKGAFFLVFLTIGAYLLSISAADFSDFLGLNYFVGGYLVAGVAGTLPEYFMIRDSIKNGNVEDASGIFVGSTLMKGTIILPAISIAFGYSFSIYNGYVLFSIILCLALFPFLKFRN